MLTCGKLQQHEHYVVSLSGEMSRCRSCMWIAKVLHTRPPFKTTFFSHSVDWISLLWYVPYYRWWSKFLSIWWFHACTWLSYACSIVRLLWKKRQSMLRIHHAPYLCIWIMCIMNVHLVWCSFIVAGIQATSLLQSVCWFRKGGLYRQVSLWS